MKKVTSIILTAALLMTLFVTVSLTAEAKKSGDFAYTVNDGEAEITTYMGSESELVIPSEFDGVPVTSIGREAFANCPELKSVIIPDSVKKIVSRAFITSNLCSVDIGDSVTSIGAQAFMSCHDLKNITFPYSLNVIEYNAFYNTRWLRDYPDGIVYAGKVVYTVKGECPDEIALNEGTKGIAEYAFYQCRSLKRITIPDSVQVIGSAAFYDCAALESITIPDSVTLIDDISFVRCASLESVTIPDSVTSIGSAAFSNCVSLEGVTILNPKTSINSTAFNGCNDLTIYGYSGSTAEMHANDKNIPFVSIDGELSTEPVETQPYIGNTDSYVDKDGKVINLAENIERAADDTTLTGISNEFKNLQILGVQKKNDYSKSIRFVSVMNNDILKDAEDYGYIVVGSTDMDNARSIVEEFSLDTAPARNVFSCKGKDNRISGDYGKFSSEKDYKYITFAVNNIGSYAIAAVFYVKDSEGNVFYAPYINSEGKEYKSCSVNWEALN